MNKVDIKLIRSIHYLYLFYLKVSLAEKFKYKYGYQVLTLTDTVGAAFDEGPLFYRKIATLVR